MNSLVLNTLFHENDKKEFLCSHLGNSAYYFKGNRNQYTILISWPIINKILMKYRLVPPRVRLVYSGENVKIEDYTSIKRERSGRLHRLLDLVAVSQQLCRGATLIIDAIDELYDPIKNLSSEMEQMFHEEIQINAYIAWGDTPGFPMHKDPHDVLIFQVMGRKKWHIVAPNHKAFSELERLTSAGTRLANDTWEFILEQGDSLYIPRGWQHEVFPLGEATIHLTTGIERRIGNDYLSWIFKNLKDLTILREAVPRFQGELSRKEYQNNLKDAMIKAINSLPIDKYLESCDSSLRLRGQINLPWSASNMLSIKPDAVIKWLLPFIIRKIQKKDIYLVEADGRTLEIRSSLATSSSVSPLLWMVT